MIEDGIYENDYFDVVTGWQFLEHVPSPRAVLNEAFRVLRPGGLIAMAMPRWNGISIRLLGKHQRNISRWHLFYFRESQIRTLLEDVGFVQVDAWSRGFNPLTFYRDLRRRFRHTATVQPQETAPLNEVSHGPLDKAYVRIPYEVLARVTGYFGMGDGLYVTAVKPSD